MENILSLNLKKVFNIVSALFLSAAVIFGSEAKADPENGYFEEKAKYGSWRTGYLYLNNETFARMVTFNHETLSAFAVDLKGNYYFASLIVAAEKSSITAVILKKQQIFFTLIFPKDLICVFLKKQEKDIL